MITFKISLWWLRIYVSIGMIFVKCRPIKELKPTGLESSKCVRLRTCRVNGVNILFGGFLSPSDDFCVLKKGIHVSFFV